MKSLIFILLALLLTACGSVNFIKKDEAALKEINEKLKGKEVTIKLFEGNAITGENVLVKTDFTTIGEDKLETSNIREISYISNGTPAGMGIGGLLGLLIGVGLGRSSDVEKGAFGGPNPLYVFTPPAVGILLGGVIGAQSGETERWIFPNKQENAKMIKVEITSVLERTKTDILILWQNKYIRLLKSEYRKIFKTADGKLSIELYEQIYLEKFN